MGKDAVIKEYIVESRVKEEEERPVPVKVKTRVVENVDLKSPKTLTENSSNQGSKTICGIIPKLLPLKIVIFLIYAGMATLYPFYTLHMKSLRINIKETAVISFLLALVGCIGVALVYTFANKIGRPKLVIIGLIFVHVFFHLFSMKIPAFEIIEIFGNENIESVEINFPCRNRENAIFSFKRQEESLFCDARNVTVLDDATNQLQFDSCLTDCPLPASHHQPSVCFLNSTGARGHYCPKWTDLERQILKNLTFAMAVPQISGSSLKQETTAFRDYESATAVPEKSRSSLNWETTAFRDDEGSLLRSAHCYAESQTAGAERPECSIVCRATASFAMVCRTDVWREGSYWLTVVAYFFLRLGGLIGLVSVLAILETVTQELVEENGGQIWLHRIFAFLALAIFSGISGLLILEEGSRATDFFWIFVLFGCLNVAAVVAVLFVTMPVGNQKSDVWRKIGKMLRSPQVVAVIIIMIVIGLAAGYYTSFLFWFLEDELSTPKYLMGIGTGLGYLLAIPLFFIAHRIIPFLGYANVLVIVLLLNAVRFVAYSYLFDPVFFLPFEFLTTLSIALTYTVLLHFSYAAAQSYESTMLALLLAATFGLGAGLGPFFAGYSLRDYGYRISFRIFAIVFFVTAIIYLLLHCLILRKTKLPTVEPAEVLPVPVSPKENPFRKSDFFPDETEILLFKEKISPIVELDEFWEVSSSKSRPVSDVSLVI